jgi:hypothetical protein
MALYKYICPKCGAKKRMLSDVRPEIPVCLLDSTPMVSDIGGSTSVIDTLDNGCMAKKVERYSNIHELRHSHATIATKEDEHII